MACAPEPLRTGYCKFIAIASGGHGSDKHICEGETTVLDAGAGFKNYQWSTGNNTQTINTSTAGTYIVTVTNFEGCQNSDTLNIIEHPRPLPLIIKHN